jgi:energy-coupling factor transporter ATP-binding protein EcfA2
MRLIKAKISGYRRLANGCEIKLDTDPVCIVGPNAAGKSSFLDALEHLNHENEFLPKEKTRVPRGAPMEPGIEARFALDEAEKKLLGEIPEATEVTQLLIHKSGNSEISYQPQPPPKRDRSKRKAALTLLQELAKSNWLSGVEQIEPQLDPAPERSTPELLKAAIEAAECDSPNLGDQIEAVVAFRERLLMVYTEQRQEDLAKERLEENPENAEDEDPSWRKWPSLAKKYEPLFTDLHALIEYEQQPHPQRQVINALLDQVPEFIPFTDLARELGSVYDLANEEPPPDGAAIHNFLALADTSWSEMLGYMQGGDAGGTEAYEERVNELLEQRAALVWEASELRVRVRIDSTALTILLSMQAHDYITFENHSDGLRQFIALRAFLARVGRTIAPIILIDEAETHLHYDAQADLVGVFEEQEDAAQIIYTTHSAGCLPRDLGLGIRAIVPELLTNSKGEKVQGDHSRVINKFWTEGRGYSPLLLAMGAGAFAFSATQKAVITEGMSDVLLLPTLIREATGKERLSYQPAPSFAEADPDQIRDFDLIAARIAFLADGDEGGRAHVKQLRDNGILDQQICYLGGAEDSGLSIEDLLDRGIYLKAVNAELHNWHQIEYPAQELPKVGRSSAVKKWCQEKSAELSKDIEVSKVDIAQRVLDQRGQEVGLLDEQYRQFLIDLDAEFNKIFEESHDRIKRLMQALADAEAASADIPPA